MYEIVSRAAVATVALMRLRGVGRRAALRVVDRPVRTPDDELALMDRAARQKLDQVMLAEAWTVAEALLEKGRDLGIGAVAFADDLYPSRLRSIPDPPAVLFFKGDRSVLTSEKSLAVVGTREPTPYGERVARRMAESGVSAGFAIVSGLAHGCDTFAHEGCVSVDGKGVAVLAHGLDKVYPAANKGLAARLLEKGGCLVSEYPLGMAPLRTAFAERDRIQSGLSDGVLVVETDVKGGTMHTVNFARQQRRALACVDHPETWRAEPKVQGNRKMIDDRWAVPIANGEAFAAFLGSLVSVHPGETSETPDNKAQGEMDF